MPDISDKIQSETFEVNKSRRYVGFEVEGYSADFTDNDSVSEDLGEVVDDCSISSGDDYSYPFEFRSRPANGDALLDYINEVGAWLDDINADANSSCGLHVHMDMSGNSQIEKRRIRRWWLAFQPLLYQMVNKYRRRNCYCEWIDSDNYRAWIDNRGYGLNIQAIGKHGTYEVRIHHGTTDRKEIRNWILLMLSFFDTFSKIPLTRERLQHIKNFTNDELTAFFWLQLTVPSGLKDYFTEKIKRYTEV